jgi:mannan endo-1,4-beta-mannosidase
MANVSWNTNEAQWVHEQTDRWPALNGFDYIHLYASWQDYTKTAVVEDWWSNGGIVSICWHWNVPVAQGSSTYAFYTKKNEHSGDGTSFSIAQAVQDGTYENTLVKADLNKVADRLLLLKQKNIPVLWRPLHEAAGGWFWWGAGGAEPLKALWKLMFDTFAAKGLNNLIWVWTAEPDDAAWYPGDEYVDVVGRDVYSKPAATSMAAEYSTLAGRHAGKLITLSECGGVANAAQQWDAGASWLWFMPWYDYERTNSPTSAAFQSSEHTYANKAWWEAAFAHPNVLSRDEMPRLKGL